MLRANVDTFDVDYTAQFADYCTYQGNSYPTGGEVTLGPYPEGNHSLSFTCSGDGGETPHTIRWVSRIPVSITMSVLPVTVVANGEDEVTVSWNAPAAHNCSHSTTEYEKEASIPFGPYSLSQTGTKTATITCGNELGSVSKTVTWEVVAPSHPGTPGNLRSSENPSTDGSFRLHWDAPTSGTAPTYYVVSSPGFSGTLQSQTVRDRSLSISGLSNGNYTYEVQACFGSTSVPNCGTAATLTVTVNIPPGPPRNFRSSENPSTDGSFRLDWDLPSSGTAPTHYMVRLLPPSGTPQSQTVTVRSLSISGVPNGIYRYEVQACYGMTSAPICGSVVTLTVTVDRPSQPPSSPMNLVAVPNPSTTGDFELSWDAPSSGPMPTGYIVNLQGSESNPLAKPFTDRTLTISGQSSGTYTYEVQACSDTANAPNCGTAAMVAVTVNRPNPPPAAPTNLVAAPNPSTTGGFELSWEAPSSGPMPTGYVVNLQGYEGNPLIKPFAARTISFSGLANGSYAYRVFACLGEEANPDCGPAASVNVTVAIPDNDNDGIPDAEDPDDDNNGMTDLWEVEHGLNPRSAEDSAQDADADGHTNLTEFNGSSDPNSAQSYPGNIPEASKGFSYGYTVERGYIGGNDQLQDILIRNPTPGIAPAIASFVLIQQASGGFVIEDAANHTIPRASQLTAINSVIRLHDLNADGYTDMLLYGLGTVVQGASNNWIVFSNYNNPQTVPNKIVELTEEKRTFFEQVAAWLDDENYFDDNASLEATVPEVNSIRILANPNGQPLIFPQLFTLTVQQLWSYGCYLPLHKCVIVEADYSDWAHATGGLGLVHRPANFDVAIVDLLDDPDEINFFGFFRLSFSSTQRYRVLDYSRFNPRALLYTNFLSLSETLERGHILSRRVSQGLEWSLGTKVFNGGLWSDNDGVFPAIIESPAYVQVVRELLKILADVRRRVCFDGSSCDTGTQSDPPEMVMPESEEECYSTDVECIRPLDIVPLPPQCSADRSTPGTITIYRMGSGPLQLSNNPDMPTVSFEASVTGMDAECEIISYDWSAQLSSTLVGKKKKRDEDGNVVRDGNNEIVYVDKPHHLGPHSFTAITTPDASNPANSWLIPWGNLISGGDLVVRVTANILFNGMEAGSVTAQTKAKITGRYEPLTGLMKAVTGVTNEKLAVAWQENEGHYHFQRNGDPTWGFPDGWGIMKLDSIPGFTRTDAHFWNWRVNFQVGIDYLDMIYNYEDENGNNHGALEWLKDRYDETDPSEDQNERSAGIDHPWGWSPHEAESSWRVWDDVFSRYNSGRTMYSPGGNRGMRHCNPDPQYIKRNQKGEVIEEDPYVNAAGCNYADDVRSHLSPPFPWDSTTP